MTRKLKTAKLQKLKSQIKDDLLANLPEGGKTILWREPDLSDKATAFATDQGPFDLPLLGSRRRNRNPYREAA